MIQLQLSTRKQKPKNNTCNIEAPEATEGGTDLSNDYTKAFEDSPSEEGIT